MKTLEPIQKLVLKEKSRKVIRGGTAYIESWHESAHDADWDVLADKLNQIIERVNLLSQEK